VTPVRSLTTCLGYKFEWDPTKAASNLKDHKVSFEEASTVLGDPLAMLMADPDHSEEEERICYWGCPYKKDCL
jgi:uncharacterized DUF497 family protein